MNVTDFYEELHLNRDDSLEVINKELSQLESTWKRREINNPEKATKILSLILEARGVFRTEAERANYDHRLAESKKVTVPADRDTEREAAYQKWLSQAQDFYYDKQFDLAKDAIVKAEQFKNPFIQDALFSLTSSFIYYEVGDLQKSFSAINDAILADPNESQFHYHKALILLDYYNEAVKKPDNLSIILDYLEKSKSSLEKALELFKRDENIQGQIECSALLAEVYAGVYNSDYGRAEKYARQAIALGDTRQEVRDLLRAIQEDKTVFQPYQGANHPSAKSGGGCYIATAVYGSYDCPEVWTLRRFRDYILAPLWCGQIFIKYYYFISPLLVRWFGRTYWFNTFWRKMLDKMVAYLKSKGISEEEYFD